MNFALSRRLSPSASRTLCAGTSILMAIPQGGRILGLWADTGENFLWTHPRLIDPVPVVADAPSTWPNPGGDRTWLAPEIDLFLGDLADAAGTYAVPSAFDPGTWRLDTESDGSMSAVLETDLKIRRKGSHARIRLKKHWRILENPSTRSAATPQAAYEQTVQLTILETSDPGLSLGIWNLAQLPAPGWMLMATHAKTLPQNVFGNLAETDFTVTPNLVVWRMAGSGDAKIALHARDFAGLAGHLHRRSDDLWDLVVREITVDPAGAYIDALWSDPSRQGWAFQACQVRSLAGGFNELEHHAPAATLGHPAEDRSRLWAWRGSAATIRALAEERFGTLPENIFTSP